MKKLLYISLLLLSFFQLTACGKEEKKMNYNKLTPEEARVIINKGTEMPFSGKFEKHWEKGTYICRQCNAPLYKSESKFDARCGWPSFDDEIAGAVKRVPDADGMRTEIICANCGGHLGHVFTGERFTEKNTRHCVNSVSLSFVPEDNMNKDTAVFASGCFWGSEYYLKRAKGVISTTVGYTGGHQENPTYKEVCTGKTGHYEAVEVVFNPEETNYAELCKIFFETHDQGQENGQGPDIGEQYRSAIFYHSEEQKKIAEELIGILKSKGYKVATALKPATQFWKAEDYHQDYYDIKGGRPYCHIYTKKF